MPSTISAGTTAGTAIAVAGDTTGNLAFRTNGTTTAMTIDTSQNVGIGTSSPATKLHVEQTTTGDAFKVARGGNYIIMGGSGSGTQYVKGYEGVVAFGNAFAGSTTFLTGDTERMRIDSSGSLLVGVTSAVDSEKVNVTQSGQFTTIYSNNTNASNAYGIRSNLSNYFFNTASFLFDGIEFSNLRFRVYSNGGIANYSGNDVNLSDQREKKNIALAPNYLDKICQIPVKTFLYINQTDTQKTLGVIAQDVQAIAPELVEETDWSENGDGSKMRLSIYQTDLQFALMKAIQELKAELDATKAEVQALKGVA